MITFLSNSEPVLFVSEYFASLVFVSQLCYKMFMFLNISVAFSRDRAEYFADKLYNAMSGMGTDDEVLQRIVMTHCEVDMIIMIKLKPKIHV